MLQKVADAAKRLPWTRQKLVGMAIDGDLPNDEQNHNERKWAKPGGPVQDPPPDCFFDVGKIGLLPLEARRARSFREKWRCIVGQTCLGEVSSGVGKSP